MLLTATSFILLPSTSLELPVKAPVTVMILNPMFKCQLSGDLSQHRLSPLLPLPLLNTSHTRLLGLLPPIPNLTWPHGFQCHLYVSILKLNSLIHLQGMTLCTLTLQPLWPHGFPLHKPASHFPPVLCPPALPSPRALWHSYLQHTLLPSLLYTHPFQPM